MAVVLGQNDPLGQVPSLVEFIGQYAPEVAHATIAAVGVAQNEPAGHGRGAVNPGGQVVPLGHSSRSEGMAQKKPGLHASSLADPAGQYEP